MNLRPLHTITLLAALLTLTACSTETPTTEPEASTETRPQLIERVTCEIIRDEIPETASIATARNVAEAIIDALEPNERRYLNQITSCPQTSLDPQIVLALAGAGSIAESVTYQPDTSLACERGEDWTGLATIDQPGLWDIRLLLEFESAQGVLEHSSSVFVDRVSADRPVRWSGWVPSSLPFGACSISLVSVTPA